MRVKPWPILLIAFVFVTAPIFNLLIGTYLTEANLIDYIQYIYYKHSLPENILWFFLPIVTGLSILRFRTWSYILLLAFIFIISIKFYYDYRTNSDLNFMFFLGFELINIAIAAYFLLPAVRNVYTKPSLRWWEQKPRYLLDQEVMIETTNQIVPGIIKNISVGGLLLQTDLNFQKGEIIKVALELFQKKLQFQCQIIYRGREGYGVFFTKVIPSQNELNKIVDQMAMQGFPLRTPTPSRSESFKKWLEDLTQGKGLVPTPDTPHNLSTPKEDK